MGRKINLLVRNLKLSTLLKKAFVGMALLLIPGCAAFPDSNPALQIAPEYQTDKLAQDWRARVKNNPNNPYDINSSSNDNDNDYQYPAYYERKSQVIRPVSYERDDHYMHQHSKDEREALHASYLASEQDSDGERPGYLN